MRVIRHLCVLTVLRLVGVKYVKINVMMHSSNSRLGMYLTLLSDLSLEVSPLAMVFSRSQSALVTRFFERLVIFFTKLGSLSMSCCHLNGLTRF